MAIKEREFYRSFRGPRAGDDDDWRLVFDDIEGRLVVRHLWRGGVDEYSLEEFLAAPSAARDALASLLFEKETADTQRT